jgi:hypothetical protein
LKRKKIEDIPRFSSCGEKEKGPGLDYFVNKKLEPGPFSV